MGRRVTGTDVGLVTGAAAGSVIGGGVSALQIGATTGILSANGLFPVPFGLVVGSGIGGYAVLSLFPWRVLFLLTAALTIFDKWAFAIGTASIRPAQLLLIPLAVRVFLMTRKEVRPAWGWAETLLCCWIVLEFATSVVNALVPSYSILTSGLLALGVLFYLTTYFGTCSRDRFIYAIRVLLLAGAASAIYADLAQVSFSALGTKFGMTILQGVGPAVQGLAYEPDILGSTCAALAIIFLALSKEENPIFPRWVCWAGFWVSVPAMIFSTARASWLAFGLAFIALHVLPRRHGPYTGIRLLRVLPTIVIALVVAPLIVFVSYVQSTGQLSSASSSSTFMYSVASIQGKIADTFAVLNGQGQGSSIQNRASVNDTAFQDVKQSPIFGLGANSYGQRHQLTTNPGKPAYIANMYIETLYDSGIIGFLLFIPVLAFLVWPSRYVRFAEGDIGLPTYGIILGVFALLVASVATQVIFLPFPWLFFGLARAGKVLTMRQDRELARERSHVGAENGRILPEEALPRTRLADWPGTT